jgi:hypothetical protein
MYNNIRIITRTGSFCLSVLFREHSLSFRISCVLGHTRWKHKATQPSQSTQDVLLQKYF